MDGLAWSPSVLLFGCAAGARRDQLASDPPAQAAGASVAVAVTSQGVDALGSQLLPARHIKWEHLTLSPKLLGSLFAFLFLRE